MSLRLNVMIYHRQSKRYPDGCVGLQGFDGPSWTRTEVNAMIDKLQQVVRAMQPDENERK